MISLWLILLIIVVIVTVALFVYRLNSDSISTAVPNVIVNRNPVVSVESIDIVPAIQAAERDALLLDKYVLYNYIPKIYDEDDDEDEYEDDDEDDEDSEDEDSEDEDDESTGVSGSNILINLLGLFIIVYVAIIIIGPAIAEYAAQTQTMNTTATGISQLPIFMSNNILVLLSIPIILFVGYNIVRN